MNQERTPRKSPVVRVRKGDVQPYTALRWVGTLFKSAAVFLGIAIVAEFMAGLRLDGRAALPVLMGELARTAVLAVVLWGAGDLVRLLIRMANDVRAQRVLLSRMAPRPATPAEPAAQPAPAEPPAPPEREAA
ncbi:MAG: hypothetical protein HY561_06475 [Gemmatimonadetes bacterium]|nr:hypothetical protein [Gemmatimonadota bacterium]